MRSGLHQLGKILEALTEALDLGPGLQAQRAVSEFAAIVGPGISTHAWAEGTRGDTLLIVTDSPVWSHQLQMLEPDLVRKLQAALGQECPVKRLRFRSGSRRRAFAPEPAPKSSDQSAAHDEAHSPARLSRRDWHDIRIAASQADDDALAKALVGVLRAQIATSPEEVGGAGKNDSSSQVEAKSPPVV